MPEWEYISEGWAGSHAGSQQRAWNTRGVADAYRAKVASFRSVLDGPGPLAVPTSASVPGNPQSVVEQNAILAFAYSLTLASRMRERMSILDWGGGIGLFALLAHALLPDDVQVDYHVKELPVVCASGREALPDLRFHEDDACLDRTYDLVLASSSLQYTEPWDELLARLARATGGYLFLTRVPVVFESRPFVVVQRPWYFVPGIEYRSWVFNRDELVLEVEGNGLRLVREFLLGHQPDVAGAPEQDETRGFLFRRRTTSAV